MCPASSPAPSPVPSPATLPPAPSPVEPTGIRSEHEASPCLVALLRGRFLSVGSVSNAKN
jgi:hypothetical protein